MTTQTENFAQLNVFVVLHPKITNFVRFFDRFVDKRIMRQDKHAKLFSKKTT